MASFPLCFECYCIRTNWSGAFTQYEPAPYSSVTQERSYMHLLMLPEVGTTPGLLVHCMRCCRRSCRLDTTWSLTLRSHRVLVGALGRYMPRFRQVQSCQTIQVNLLMSSPTTDNSFHSNNPQNGGCAPYKEHLIASMSPSILGTNNSNKIC